jgi:hypothetical protein
VGDSLTTAVDRPRCGAKTRNGARCKRRAGERTVHVGEGKCWMHGGVKEGDARVKHYRYSSMRRERIAELIAEHQRDPDPLNILPEIAALRALFQEFVERYDENTEALLAWHASFQLSRNPLPEELVMSFEALVQEWEIKLKESGDDPTPKQQGDLEQSQKFLKLLREGTDAAKPRTVLDLTDAYRVLGEIGRMVERVEKIRNINGITRMDLNRVIGEMGRVVDALVMDDAVKAKIRDGWLGIRI